MSALPRPLFEDVLSALAASGHEDLVRQLEAHRPREVLTSGQAAALLGLSSANTVKNWLEAGHFPGAYRTAGGHWRFRRDEVEAAKARMDALHEKNRRGDLAPPDAGDEDYPPPPWL